MLYVVVTSLLVQVFNLKQFIKTKGSDYKSEPAETEYKKP
jgi:hypothetical protein